MLPRLSTVGRSPDTAQIGSDKQGAVVGQNMLAVKALQFRAARLPTLSANGGAEDVLIGGDKDSIADSRQRLGVQRGEAAIGKRPMAAVVVADADAPAGGRVGGPVVAEQESDILAARTGQLLRLREEGYDPHEKKEQKKVLHGYLLLW